MWSNICILFHLWCFEYILSYEFLWFFFVNFEVDFLRFVFFAPMVFK